MRQVVSLAAGLDTRAFRLEWPSETVVYELDRPYLLAAKQATLDEVGARPRCRRRIVGVDLADDWAAVLPSVGHRSSEATLWIAEGLLVYLPDHTAIRVLSTAASLSAPGSALLCDLVGESAARSPYMQDWLRLLADQNTPWQFFTRDPEMTLSASGWTADWIDELGSASADFGRWPYPKMPDPVPEFMRELARSLPRTSAVLGDIYPLASELRQLHEIRFTGQHYDSRRRGSLVVITETEPATGQPDPELLDATAEVAAQFPPP